MFIVKTLKHFVSLLHTVFPITYSCQWCRKDCIPCVRLFWSIVLLLHPHSSMHSLSLCNTWSLRTHSYHTQTYLMTLHTLSHMPLGLVYILWTSQRHYIRGLLISSGSLKIMIRVKENRISYSAFVQNSYVPYKKYPMTLHTFLHTP